jgi:hypothetical protein
MKLRNILIIKLIACSLLATAVVGDAFPQEHIRDLGAVRESMAQLGNKLPELIKNADPKYLRTLERTFEINNYALVTIESYMKMVKVAISSGGSINKDIVGVLNGWLGFIKHYCEYDVKYFDEALAETKDNAITAVLKAEKENITKLRNISEKGVAENVELSKKI